MSDSDGSFTDEEEEEAEGLFGGEGELVDDTGFVYVDPDAREAFSDPEIEGSDDDEGSGEDLMETMEQDERTINPALDRYASDDLDERKHGPMSAGQRKEAERAMRQRDREERRLAEKSRLPAALLESSSDEEQLGFLQRRRQQRRERKKAQREGKGGELGDDGGWTMTRRRATAMRRTRTRTRTKRTSTWT
ncbi:MAG: hypothetical protein Q8P67_08060 [archaeon]|nr:hypothetical protein [archaeon]